MTIATLAKLAASGVVRPDERVVAYVTGHGLKTVEALVDAVGPTATIAPTLDAFHEAVAIDATVDRRPPVSVTVRIPTQLRTLTGGAARSRSRGRRSARCSRPSTPPTPGSADRLFDDAGNLRRFVNVFLADEDVRFLDGLDTLVADGQTLSIVPAVAGG